MSAWDFPKSINVDGIEYDIRTDYRDILNLLTALNDPELHDEDEQMNSYMQVRVILEIMYINWEDIPQEHWEEAVNKASEFIDMGIAEPGKGPKAMDWEKDAAIIIPAVNRVLNCEIRAQEYVHWWTFLGAYMELGECLFSNVINIRRKKIEGKKLEEWEKEFYKKNKNLIDFEKESRSDEEKAKLREIFFSHKK